MNDCILWDGPVMSTGYGVRYVPSTGYGHKNYRTVLAHRYAYEEEYGPIPADHHLHHRCHTKLCVNPRHLQPLTNREHRGASGHGKLTQEKANEIRALRAAGVSGKELAFQFDVSVQQVCNIHKGRCWA